MKRELKLLLKNRYGRDLIYPACPEAITLCALTGRKTFLDTDLILLRQLGYELVWLAEQPKEVSGE